MSAGWVAGSLRARLLVSRRLGPEGARQLAASPSLRDAVVELSRSDLGRDGAIEDDLAGAQRQVAEATLLRLRLLAGWLPPAALPLLRPLAAWFELANVEDRLAYLLGGERPRPFELGGLAWAGSVGAGAQSAEELRAALAASPWGDPGSVDPPAVHRALQLAWARRVLLAAPEIHEWVAGALALLVARDLLLAGHPAETLPRERLGVLGAAWPRAQTLTELPAALPARAAWPLAGLTAPAELWRGEVRWWQRVERDAEALLRRPGEGRHVVIGAVALLAADARRVQSVLEAVARGAQAELEAIVDARA